MLKQVVMMYTLVLMPPFSQQIPCYYCVTEQISKLIWVIELLLLLPSSLFCFTVSITLAIILHIGCLTTPSIAT